MNENKIKYLKSISGEVTIFLDNGKRSYTGGIITVDGPWVIFNDKFNNRVLIDADKISDIVIKSEVKNYG